jgi:Sec-independent protein translocase protein TatA
MLALFQNIGPLEILVIVVVAVLIFGQDLPQAASKAYLQLRKLRGAVDDLRRDSGIERELRDIERRVREAEWEARRVERPAPRALGAPAAPAPAPPPTPPPAAENTPEPPHAATEGEQTPSP